MSVYKEFEDIIFEFTVEASAIGGQAAMDAVEYGHTFHFVDKDAIKFLKENASTLSQSSLKRLNGNLDEVIQAGVADGKPIKAITNDVLTIFSDFKGWEAERIARTETTRGVANGALIGYKDMGIEIVEFIANAGACPICVSYHGTTLTTGDAFNLIPVHPNCYCYWVSRPDLKPKVK